MLQATLVQSAHNPQVSIVKGQPITTSLNVAEVFERNHKEVLRSIDKLLTQVPENISKRNFAPSVYTDGSGKKNPYYELAFDGFMLLVMGFSGAKAMQFKIAYIEEFNRMREHLNDTNVADIPLTPSTTTTRKPLTSLVKTWARQTNQRFSDCYRQVNAHFNFDTVEKLPVELIPKAIAFVQSKLDAHQLALCARQEQLAITSERQSLSDLVPVQPQQSTCPFTPPTFTEQEMLTGAQLAKLFDKHFTNLAAVIKESDKLYQHFRFWGDMGNKKMGLSKEVQMLFENGNNSMQMVKAAMYMAQHGLKNALNIKATCDFM